MAVQTAKNGQALQPDSLSIIPPEFSLELDGRTIELKKRQKPPGGFRPIDHFFMAMARELKEQAIAVVLSGSSADGAKGVIEVRDAGGLTMAQSEETAEYTSMPRQALLTDKVDFCRQRRRRSAGCWERSPATPTSIPKPCPKPRAPNRTAATTRTDPAAAAQDRSRFFQLQAEYPAAAHFATNGPQPDPVPGRVRRPASQTPPRS